MRLSKSSAAALNVSDGAEVVVATERGEIRLPAQLSDMPDGVVWVPTNSPGATLHRTLGVTSGATVTLSRGDTEGGAR